MKVASGLIYPAPVESPREVVAGAERQDGNRRRGMNVETVNGRQDPADSAVTSARQQTQVRHLAKHLQPAHVRSHNVMCTRR